MAFESLDLAEEALGVLAVDPHGLGGGLLRVRPGPHLDAWLTAFREALPGIPVRKIPAHAETARLAGEIDVVSTLATGRRTARPGLLAETDGGAVVVPMAERTAPEVAALLAEALDTGAVAPREHGLEPASARLAVLLLDESRPDEAGAPVLLADRLAVHVAVDPRPGGGTVTGPGPERAESARRRLASVEASEEQVEALVAAGDGLGVPTARALIGAVRAARARAALFGRAAPNDDDLAVAVALVLLPRARRLPAEPPPEEAEAPPPPPPPEAPEEGGDDEPANEPTGPLADRVVEAALARLPDGTLELETGRGVGGGGRRGALIRQLHHGRRIGARRGDPRRGGRVDLTATLRAAAPWQPGRRKRTPDRPGRLRIHRDDLHVQVRARRAATATIFVVDASGSQALNRLAEVKGAVELLLADSYVRREQVALVAFRGRDAELVLPPTRSLVRARRVLSGMVGGGGTPLALGILEGLRVALRVRSDEASPRMVLLSDGRPNVDREGKGGRAQAREDALAAGRRVAATGVPALVLDTSPRGEAFAHELAAAMGGRAAHLPRADARRVRAALSALDRTG
jgi:magnesium chelatase subunit D